MEDQNKALDITINHYHYRCGDGCCDEYGIKVIVNGEELPLHNEDLYTQIEQILEHLGYKVNIIEQYNGEE
jgi:hypothetical protein